MAKAHSVLARPPWVVVLPVKHFRLPTNTILQHTIYGPLRVSMYGLRSDDTMNLRIGDFFQEAHLRHTIPVEQIITLNRSLELPGLSPFSRLCTLALL